MQSFAARMALVCLTGVACLAQTASKPAAAKPAAVKPAAVQKKSALDLTTFEQYIRHVNRWGKQIQVTVASPKPSTVLPGFRDVLVSATDGTRSAEVLYHVSGDGGRIFRGDVFDVNDNPFRANLAKLKTDFQPSIGTPGAPVVIVLFSDFECGYCKEEGKMLRQNLLSAYPKEVRLYFKDLPIEQIHPWAKPAAIAGRCIYQQNPASFWPYHDWVFENQANLTAENFKEKALAYVTGAKVDVLQFTRCLDTRATEAEVERSLAEARELNVFSTPTMFINGRKVEGQVSWPDLRDIIDIEIEYQKTAKNAGENCNCEVSLPLGK